jgi:AcrR family transcriptional regulator
MSPVRELPVMNARQRILDASYDLFVDRGVRAVGINEIIRTAGVAKASFYSHFPSKNDLVMAFLGRRQELFTIGYLGAEARKRGDSPRDQLLAIFDIFDEWFQTEDFTGCPYIRALVETGADDEVGRASASYLRDMRDEVGSTAAAMGLTDPGDFAECWMILLQGSVVAAMGTGYTSPTRIRKLGQLLIESHTPNRATPKQAGNAEALQVPPLA